MMKIPTATAAAEKKEIKKVDLLARGWCCSTGFLSAPAIDGSVASEH